MLNIVLLEDFLVCFFLVLPHLRSQSSCSGLGGLETIIKCKLGAQRGEESEDLRERNSHLSPAGDSSPGAALSLGQMSREGFFHNSISIGIIRRQQ